MIVEHDPDLVGGRYELGPVIGTGGMATVRRAHDVRLERDVAIKFLRSDLAAQPGVRERFAHEARVAASLGHPMAVSVFDTGEHDGSPYIVMELLEGRTVADEIAAGPLAEERVRAIALDVLGALDAAHTMGIVHRDIKPANLLLGPDGAVKVADFGIAKSVDALDVTLTSQLLGTAVYLAPERLEGKAATAQTDLYSLGVVLYEALSGRRAFAGENPIAVLHAIHSTRPPSLRVVRPDVSDEMAAMVDRAMDRDPRRRYRRAAEMADALRSAAGRAHGSSVDATSLVLRTTPLPVHAPSPPAPAPSPSGRSATTARPTRARPRPRRSVGWLAFALVAGLLATVGFALANDPEPSGSEPGITSTAVPTVPESIASTVAPGGEPTLPPSLAEALGALEESVAP